MEDHGAEAMLSVDDARARVLSAVEPLEVISMALMEARGYAVTSDVFAPHDLPRFANSAMDGFAVRSSDASHASERDPVRLRIVGEVRAGDPGRSEVSPGTAVRIMTGAPVPPGGDAVVPVADPIECAQRLRGLVVAATPNEHGVVQGRLVGFLTRPGRNRW